MTQSFPRPEPVTIHRDVRIPTRRPGETLSADLYLPEHPRRVPALVTVVPYRKDLGSEYEPALRWFAAHGYAGVLAENAGIGSSDGVPHSPWSTGETDDALDVISWVGERSWCDGAVGMWGISHGGFTAMRAAARRPAGLRAIMPIMNAIDVVRDVLHPDGVRGEFVRLAMWGGSQLLQQLLPPLHGHDSADGQHRWRHRLDAVEPYLVELADLQPDDPRWRDRVVRLEDITVPAFCVGGWQDLYPRTVLGDVLDRLRVPRKLLVGPWGHTLPQESPFAAVDFLPLAARWWDHWLRGVDTGLMREPELTVWLQGERPEWRAYEHWPPGSATLNLSGRDWVRTSPDRADPTIGALSGLRGIALGTIARPRDQRADDARAFTFTGPALEREVLLCGTPLVTLSFAARPLSQPVVVRLTHVAPDGASRFITSGTQADIGGGLETDVALTPVAYRVPAGHRLRLVAGAGDFPRLAPAPPMPPPTFADVTITVPTCSSEAGVPVDLSPINGPESAPGRWELRRAPRGESVELTVETSRSVKVEEGHTLDLTSRYEAYSHVGRHGAALLTGHHHADIRTAGGAETTVDVTVDCRPQGVLASGRIVENGIVTFDQTWHLSIDPG
ncbi:CocE/NonD family hydrolase [Amycolatopsis sacchari]|uniref:CocE/NonD family hydrolase n=1 Tax=Amycolatopsis sacchari TaxID=115433 RepID=UPI003EBB2097